MQFSVRVLIHLPFPPDEQLRLIDARLANAEKLPPRLDATRKAAVLDEVVFVQINLLVTQSSTVTVSGIRFKSLSTPSD